MEKEFKQYTLEDFLDDADFCAWARSERPDLEGLYHDLLKKHPGQLAVFQRAKRLVGLFDDGKLKTDPLRKLQIWEEINRTYRGRKKASLPRLILRYAAMLVLFFSLGTSVWYFMERESGRELRSWPVQDYSEVMLLLDDGQKIAIPSDRPQNFGFGADGQVRINGELVKQAPNAQVSRLNELIVPFGKQAKVELSDHTQVWLNAGSRLVFPSQFGKGKRKVQLQGEAFFKVSRDPSRLFTVETSRSAVNVLGTSFNLRAYPDERTEEAVLEEGSVSMKVGKSIFGDEVVLKPAQQLIAGYPERSYTIYGVDAQNYTSWTAGLLLFRGEPLSDVLKRISRFYNIPIRWDDTDQNREIWGKLDLKQDYQRVLNALSLISQGSYTERNGIIIFKLEESNDQ